MSHHYFYTTYNGRRVEVEIGYDRPLDHVFMTVRYIDPPSSALATSGQDDDRVLYSNLHDPRGMRQQDVGYYREQLCALGLTVPESLFREPMRDAFARVGNHSYVHDAAGGMAPIGAEFPRGTS